MNDPLLDFYQLPDIEKYENFHLQTLSEQCDILEEQLRAIIAPLPEKDRSVIEAYLDMRNDLEVETIRTALRWGMNYSKNANLTKGFPFSR